jgi:hypothetical protein
MLLLANATSANHESKLSVSQPVLLVVHSFIVRVGRGGPIGSGAGGIFRDRAEFYARQNSFRASYATGFVCVNNAVERNVVATGSERKEHAGRPGEIAN